MKIFSESEAAKDIKIKNISLSSSTETIKWERNKEGLFVTAPQTIPEEGAIVYKLEIEKD